MIHKHSDQQLSEMGVADYHIRQWHKDEIFEIALARTKRTFSFLDKLFNAAFSSELLEVAEKVKRGL